MSGYVMYGPDGITLVQTLVDNGDGTGVLTEYQNGVVSVVTNVDGLGINPLYQPLDATGALATLLVVAGVLRLQDASNAIGEEPAHLIAEAEAWSLGS